MRVIFLISVLLILRANGQCEFPSTFASSTWLDSTRGTLTFGTTTMSGWSVTVFNQQRSTWECVDSSDTTTLVMKATQSISYSTSQIYIFMCMKLTQITTNSYSYTLQQVQQPNAGYERLWFSSDSTLSTISTICDTSASIPTLEFHVLVKQGMAASAAITFPNNLLFSGDYKYMTSTGNIACNGSDTMDMCSDTTALSFQNYTNCDQEIAFSADGELWCVANSSLDSYDCAVVYNRDETISGTASQFACLCSDGSSVSVVSGNCTSDQVASSYPTAADGTTVIGYLLTIETVYAPTSSGSSSSSSSSSSNLTVIIIVVVLLLLVIIIAVVLIIILYKRGHCVTICDRLDKCCGKSPCWPFCRNKVCFCCANKMERPESTKPIMLNGTSAHTETINETSKSKLTRDKTSMSAITRSSTMAIDREKSELEKSLQRQTTATSIGFDMKSERSSVHQIKVKSKDDDDEKEPRLKLLGIDMSFLVCCPEKKDEVKSVRLVEPLEEKPLSPEKKSAKGGAKKGTNKATKGGKEGKGKGGKGKGKGGKGKEKDVKTEEKVLENGKVGKEEEKVVGNEEGSPAKEKVDKGGKKNKNKAKVQPKDSPRAGDVTLTDIENKSFPENDALTRAPTKMKSDLRLTSTPVPGGEKGQKHVVSVPAGLLKPQDKPTEWTFLSCCFGKRSPPPTEVTEELATPAFSAKGKGKPAAKGKGGAQKKGTATAGKKASKKGGGGKGGVKKKDVNENDVEKDDTPSELKPIERAKTMPEREKTALSLQEAEHVKVAVYIPTEKTNLQLKDTVINGPPKLEKSKTDAGLARPPSSRPASSVKQSEKKGGKKGNQKTEKGKDKGKKDKKKKSKK